MYITAIERNSLYVKAKEEFLRTDNFEDVI